MYLVISGEHHTYHQEWKSHQQIGHGLSLTIKCQLVSYDYCLITQNLNKTVFKKFGCQKGCRKNSKCKKVEMMKCLLTCKCRGKCEENYHFIIIKINGKNAK